MSIIKVRKLVKRYGVVALGVLAGLFAHQPAYAIQAGAGITVANGEIALVTPVAVANGGTGLTIATEDATVVGNGSAWAAKVLPSCSGATQALSYDSSANAFGCTAITATSVNSVLVFASETKIDLNSAGTATAYLGLGGRVSTTETDVTVPISAATLGNLRCVASSAVGGTSLTVTLGLGACTGGMSYGSLLVTPSAANTAVSYTSTTTATTANQCVALKVVASGDTNPVFVSCTLDRTA